MYVINKKRNERGSKECVSWEIYSCHSTRNYLKIERKEGVVNHVVLYWLFLHSKDFFIIIKGTWMYNSFIVNINWIDSTFLESHPSFYLSPFYRLIYSKIHSALLIMQLLHHDQPYQLASTTLQHTSFFLSSSQTP